MRRLKQNIDSRLRGNDGGKAVKRRSAKHKPKPNQTKPTKTKTKTKPNPFRVFFCALCVISASSAFCPRIPAQQNPFLVFFATSAHLLRLLRSAPVPVPAPSLLRLLANGWLFQGGGENLCHFYRIKAVLLAAKLAAYFDLALLGDDAVGFFLP